MFDKPTSNFLQTIPEGALLPVYAGGYPSWLELRKQHSNSPKAYPAGGYSLVIVDQNGLMTDLAGNSVSAIPNRATYAAVVASTGVSVDQTKFVTDYGLGAGLDPQMRWTGTKWVWIPQLQLIGRQYAAQTVPGDTNEATLFTCNIPPLGANDALLLRVGWTLTNSANSKTERLKLDATTMYSNAFAAGAATDVRDYFIRNRNATNSQIMGPTNNQLYGQSTAAVGTAAFQTSAASVLTLTGQKASGGEVMTMEWAELFLLGGTV